MKTIYGILKAFPTEKACLDRLKKAHGTACRHCGHKETYECKVRNLYKCKRCEKQFTLKIGTIFEKSRIPLPKWFMAIYLLNSSSKGIASTQLAEKLGVTQKTAWFMYHRIRQTHKQNLPVFKGVAEADETFVGGKEANKHSNKKTPKSQGGQNKEVVIGLMRREPKAVMACHLPNSKAKTLKDFIYDNLEYGSTLMTDDNLAYRHTRWLYTHNAIAHSRELYAKDDIYTNNIENFWSIFKRGYVGVYHYMSPKHLQRFVNEYVFRYNNKYTDKFHISIENSRDRLTYKELVGGIA